ncbi:PREDICTED: GTP cyclohydrolase 1 feedback regulatory protein [Nipponia nippon]|nr:PREDICTED: GTP cyclohydrolase 1 feedback regulatory protein [Nipponia nippon]
MVRKANQQAGRSLVKDAAAAVGAIPLRARLKPSERQLKLAVFGGSPEGAGVRPGAGSVAAAPAALSEEGRLWAPRWGARCLARSPAPGAADSGPSVVKAVSSGLPAPALQGGWVLPACSPAVPGPWIPGDQGHEGSASSWPSGSKATKVLSWDRRWLAVIPVPKLLLGLARGAGRGEAALPPVAHLLCCRSLQEVGPTMVGDEHSDPGLMSFLGATKRNMLGNHFWEYYVNDAPRIVLNKLESCGYRVVSMTGVGQTLVWCLHKE